MRILFLHPNFPAQFRHVAGAIAKDKRHQVVFGTTRRDGSLPGVTKMLYSPKREARPETHHYIRPLENAVIQGQAVYRMAEQLKARGFVPDVVYGHSGWGPTLLMKDIFPKAKLLCYFEWFYHAHGSDADFDPSERLTADDEARIRIKNTPILVDLYSCDRGLSPTYWQRQQFPSEYQDKIKVLHDGIDTNFFCPKPGAKLVLPRINLDLSHVEELVTYVGRGMEPYRGFPQFIEAIYLLQQRRPQCHVVIVGEDRVAYGRTLPDGKTYKQLMLEKFPLDLSRVHFTGHLPYEEYLQVLQASSAHVYLTRPFVLSWSLLESLSTGCLVVGSNTAPVAEVIQDGVNGLLANFFSPEEIADRLEEALKNRDRMNEIRANARQTILKHYDLSLLLPQHLEWIQQSVGGSQIPLWTGTQFKSVTPIEANRANGKHKEAEHSPVRELVTTSNGFSSNGKHKSIQHSPTQKRFTTNGFSSNGKHKGKNHSPTRKLVNTTKGFSSNGKHQDEEHSPTTELVANVQPQDEEQLATTELTAIAPNNQLNVHQDEEPLSTTELTANVQPQDEEPLSTTELVANVQPQDGEDSLTTDPATLQIGNRTVTSTELLSLLSQYQLLPKLQQEIIIDDAIASFECTPEEQAKCCQDFYNQNQLTSDAERQTWLQQQGMTEAQLINLATRQLRIEKFKQATWGNNLENYFLKRKYQLDQYVYSLIRVRDAAAAREFYFRLKEGEQTFAELAEQYSEGSEAQTGGIIGPVPLGLSHPRLAAILKASQPGQLLPPSRIEDLWIIVRLEKMLPAQFDAPMRQKLLNELFANWLKEQLKKPVASFG